MAEVSPAGGTIAAVDAGAALRAGLRPGDVVMAVDGEPVRDIIDWWWHTDEPDFVATVLRAGVSLQVKVLRVTGEPLGVAFTQDLFDGVRQCDNSCAFCFVAGLPPGLRPALYVRDDDYRLSFLSGNFITLTNIAEEDVARIIRQHLSPLHVSVHAVDPGVRARLICPTSGDTALETLDRLHEAGVEVHAQIVLVPGVNDGDILEETLAYLAARPGVLSVGTVPMGYTAHQQRWASSYNREGAADVLARVAAWQTRSRAERGAGWVYAADEFYLLAASDLPAGSAYDDFPQFENGIGMAAAFRDEFAVRAKAAGARASGAQKPRVPTTLITGELFAPVLRTVLDHAGRTDVAVLPVANRFFGGNVSVAGLLCASDIAEAVRADGGGGVYLVPDVVVNSDGLLLDEVPATALGSLAGTDVRFVGSDAGSLADALKPAEGRAPK